MIKHRSLLMLFSDLLTDTDAVVESLHLLRHAGHDVIVFHILDEAEVSFPFSGMVDLKDPESGESLVLDAAREALRPVPMGSGFVADLFRSRNELLAENAMLGQQLIAAKRKVKQPEFRPLERGLMVVLSSMVRNWQNAVLLVKPDTVLRWHREGFRLLWKRKSKATKPRQPRISAETIELIRQMAVQNKTWGAERIRGELLKLGIRVAKRTIQRHILAVRPPGDGQSWKTFPQSLCVGLRLRAGL